MPAVNQELALKYMDDGDGRRLKTGNLLQDDRFKALFSNPEFEVNKNAEEYKMLTPVLSRLDKGKVKELKRKMAGKMAFEDDEPTKSSDDDLFSEQDSDEAQSSDDEDKAEMQKDLKRTYRQIRKENKAAAMEPDDDEDEDAENGDGVAGNSFDRRPANGGAAPVFKVRNITTKLNRWVAANGGRKTCFRSLFEAFFFSQIM